MIKVELKPNEKFYPAVGPYRSFHSNPKYIIKEVNSFDEALKVIEGYSIPEDGKSIFIKRKNNYIEVYEKNENYYINDYSKELFFI